MKGNSCVKDIAGEKVVSLECLPVAIANVVNWLLILAVPITLFFIILAGINYTMSGGEEKKKENAKKTLTYGIFGFIVIILSFFIIRVIAYITNVDCINTFGFSAC